MKNIFKIAVLTVAVFTISCNDAFMDRMPLDKINDGAFWTSTTDLRLYLNSLYSRNDLLPRDDGWGSVGIYGWDADNGSDTQVWYNYNSRMNGEGTVPTSGGGWDASDWMALRQINHFMDNYSKVETIVGTPAVQPFVGEALFFRSIFYFAKLRRFGDLPWASSVVQTDSEVLFASRLPRNQVVDSIMQDLDRAVAYLPARLGGVWTGRVTKETAMALQARIALYEGTWQKYHANTVFAGQENNSTRLLEKAVEVAGALIAQSENIGWPALSGVGVPNGYRDLFNQSDYSQNREVMFWKMYRVGESTNNWSRYSGNGGGRGATQSMMNSYLMLDGNPIPADFDNTTLAKVATGRDSRLAQSVQINDGQHFIWEGANPKRFFWVPTWDGWDANESAATDYQLLKGHNQRLADAWPGGQGTEAMIYFRFGEVLLIYAEAKAELGIITQADLDRSINLLRRRLVPQMPDLTIGVASDPNFEFASLSPIIQAIRRERKVELAFEGFRVDDIMRWRAAGELIVGKIPVGGYLAQWQSFRFDELGPNAAIEITRQAAIDAAVSGMIADENGHIKIFRNTLNGGTQGFRFNEGRDYLFPINTNQLTINPNLTQNPGW